MDNPRLYDLFNRYTVGQLTASEELELAAMVIDPDNETTFAELEATYWERLKNVSDPLAGSAEQSLRTILPGRVVPMHRRLVKMTAAASILLLVGLGSYLIFFNRNKQEEIAKTIETAKDVKAPESNRAMITLADGRKVYLDSAMNGELAFQGNVKLVKLANGQIAYQTASGEIAKELQFNTLNNPRGSKVIDMQLSDGSHVWLNAGSSVTFPIAFVGNERKVSVTGEAYFEISHDKTKPFIVSANNKADVTVLGTHFNVNAYDDEATLKVTLLEGSISVNNTIIKPGQQAQVSSDIKVVNKVDLAEVMAWKNGNFKFTRTDLKVIMREIGRWYDVEVSYEGNIPVQLYNIGVPRTANVSEVLRGLEFTGAHFSIEGKKIIVRP